MLLQENKSNFSIINKQEDKLVDSTYFNDFYELIPNQLLYIGYWRAKIEKEGLPYGFGKYIELE